MSTCTLAIHKTIIATSAFVGVFGHDHAVEHNGRPFRGSIAVAKDTYQAELRSSRWRCLFTDAYVDAATRVTQLLRPSKAHTQNGRSAFRDFG